jgi:hypothetical protein
MPAPHNERLALEPEPEGLPHQSALVIQALVGRWWLLVFGELERQLRLSARVGGRRLLDRGGVLGARRARGLRER